MANLMETGFGDFIAGDGDDLINGSAEDDPLYGGAGNDVVYGGDGADFIFGDEPTRYFNFPGQPGTSDGGDDRIFGKSGDDTIIGGIGSDIIDGGDGDDLLMGDGVFWSAEHGDYPTGQPDVIRGGAGDDRIYGGLGADTLYGGAGADTFYFRLMTNTEYYDEDVVTDSLVGHGMRDVIKDFEVGVDKIVLDNIYIEGQVTIAQHSPGWTMLKIDLDFDSKTDAQILVHTGAGVLTLDMLI